MLTAVCSYGERAKNVDLQHGCGVIRPHPSMMTNRLQVCFHSLFSYALFAFVPKNHDEKARLNLAKSSTCWHISKQIFLKDTVTGRATAARCSIPLLQYKEGRLA